MTPIQGLLLGAVQGLTEFLPISSSGHLVIVPALLGWKEPGLAFDVVLHVGSLLALFFYFSGEIIDMIRGLMGRDRDALRMLSLIVVGTVPAVFAGLVFHDYFQRSFNDAFSSAIQLVITGLILIAAELAGGRHERRAAERGRRLRRLDELGYRDAVLVGGAQAIAIIPGISRSGATIGTALSLAVDRDDAARFSFLLSIPALLGAAVLEAPAVSSAPQIGLSGAIAGLVTSFAVSYAAIAGLIRFLRTHTLYPFAIYCLVAGTIFAFVV
jgi:undecaprenyl-diphosphatase